MKKILLPSAVLIMMLLSSCTKESYFITDVNSFSRYYTIRSSDWILFDIPPTPQDPDESSRYTHFYCDVAVPQLTDGVFDFGVMNGYLTNEGDRSLVFPLPYDDFYMNNGMWTEQVTCEFSPGNVRFILKYNDFNMHIQPLSYTFLVRFLW